MSTTNLPGYQSRIDPPHRRASSLGTVFEWYDFYHLMTVVIGAFFLAETKDYAVI